MQAAEAADGRRYAAWFRINFSRCIFCGLCAEACPTMAIQTTPDYEICNRDVLKLAYRRMQQILEEEWQARSADLPYRNSYEALIMASLVEKETGMAAEVEVRGVRYEAHAEGTLARISIGASAVPTPRKVGPLASS